MHYRLIMYGLTADETLSFFIKEKDGLSQDQSGSTDVNSLQDSQNTALANVYRGSTTLFLIDFSGKNNSFNLQ